MDIETFLTDARQKIDDKLCALVSSSSDLPYSALFASARYSLSSPGKRLRPLLVLATAASYGAPLEKALAPACAIEMIHTYSLIHDDLPCMDDDDLRRGQPTLHKMVPEWHALLTGDYLLTYAFEILSDAPSLSSEQKISLVRTLASRAGAHGMIGGQMIDLLSVGQTVDWEILEQMHLGKTAGLITAALEFGGIIADVPPDDIISLRKTGLAIGTAFQLIDDVLDYTSTEEELGKPIGSDHSKSKATAVPLLGIHHTKEKAALLLQAAEENLNTLSRPVPLIRALFDQMVNRRK
ncbi:MAG: polyprenyl synthetase family protein [Verrucomicrobia bacterium]|nr:polyprenyl synthetase family protein [Verrucomicrobiota bacterium]